MAWQIEQRIDLGDAHALARFGDLDDGIAGRNIAFLQDPEVEARFAARGQERRHAWLVHANADAIAGDARLGHFEQGAADLVAVADAHLVVGQAFDGEVFAELTVAELSAAQLLFPVAIGFDLVDEHCAMLAAMTDEVALTVAVDVEPSYHAPAWNRRLPDGGVHALAVPPDVTWKPSVYRKQPRHDGPHPSTF